MSAAHTSTGPPAVLERVHDPGERVARLVGLVPALDAGQLGQLACRACRRPRRARRPRPAPRPDRPRAAARRPAQPASSRRPSRLPEPPASSAPITGGQASDAVGSPRPWASGAFIAVGKSLETALQRVELAERLGLRVRLRDPHRRARLGHGADGLRGPQRAARARHRRACRSTRARRSRPRSRSPRSTSSPAGGAIIGLGVSHRPWSRPGTARRSTSRCARCASTCGHRARDPARRGPARRASGSRSAFRFMGYEPRPDIPIYLAGLSPGMLRLAGEIADGVVLWLCNPDYIREVVVPDGRRGPREGRQAARGLRHRGGRAVGGHRRARAGAGPAALRADPVLLAALLPQDDRALRLRRRHRRLRPRRAATAISDEFLSSLAAIGRAGGVRRHRAPLRRQRHDLALHRRHLADGLRHHARGARRAASRNTSVYVSLPAGRSRSDEEGVPCAGTASLGALFAPTRHAADVYSYAGGCYALRDATTNRYVARDSLGYSASATSVAAATPFRMQATALGRYLLYGPDGKMPADGRARHARRHDHARPHRRLEGRGRRLDGAPDQLLDRQAARRRRPRAAGPGDARALDVPARPGLRDLPRGRGQRHRTPLQGLEPDGARARLPRRPHPPRRLRVPRRALPLRPALEPLRRDRRAARLPRPLPQRRGRGGRELHLNRHRRSAPTAPRAGRRFAGWPRDESQTHEGTYWKWIERVLAVGAAADGQRPRREPGPVRALPAQEERLQRDGRAPTSRRRTCTTCRTTSTPSSAVRARASSGWSARPTEARKVINQGKLAVVLGVEVSEVLDCEQFNGTPKCDAAQIDRELDKLYAAGVRSLFPVHKFDNALGGTKFDSGATGVLVNTGNKWVTGQFWAADHCDDADHDNTPTPIGNDQAQLIYTLFGPVLDPAPVPGPAARLSARSALQPQGPHPARRAPDPGDDEQGHDRRDRSHEREDAPADALHPRGDEATPA